MKIVKQNSDIWEYVDIEFDSVLFLKKLKDNEWLSYTNNGGGSTIIGESIGIDPQHEWYNKILNVFVECLSDYLSQHSINLSLEGLDVMPMPDRKWLEQKYLGIRRYDSGSIMFAHEDGGVPIAPRYTALFYFNEDYDGGEISFPDKNLSIKPNKNSVIIFPSKTVHQVDMLKSGSRYLTSCYLYERE